MDHRQALTTKASERYLLGEMAEPERFAFEDHYFQCGDCAEDVRAGSAFVRGIRAVASDTGRAAFAAASPLRPRFSWLTPAALLPAAALLVVGCLAAYQALVTIPALRAPRALSAVVLRAAARGDEQVIEVHSGQSLSVLSLDVNAVAPGTPLLYELTPAGGAVRSRGPATAPPPGSPLLLVMPRDAIAQAGAWTLFLRTPQGVEVARYPFSVKLD